MAKQTKKQKQIQEIIQTIDSTNLNSIIEKFQSLNKFKFDQSYELISSVNQGKNHQPTKISVIYPNSFGDTVKILFLGEPKEQEDAKNAGADYVGLEDYIKEITENSWMDFDIVLATPTVMPKIAKLGRILGTKGLMPNPKTGTLTTNITKTVEEFKKGKKNFKEDKTGSIKMVFGKTSMEKDKIKENFLSLLSNIKENIGIGQVKTSYVKLSMTPPVKVNLSNLTV